MSTAPGLGLAALVLVLVLVLGAADARAAPPALPPVETGDVVFHTSQSKQAPVIMAATESPYSHVGLIVMERGKPVVVEASGTVKRTPLAQFIKRGKAGRYTILRRPGLTDADRSRIAEAALSHIGKPYDWFFLPGVDRLYCSELVRAAYDAAGIGVGRWQTMGELHVDEKLEKQAAPRLKKLPFCRGVGIERCASIAKLVPVVTPASLAEDTSMVTVASNYPP